MSIGISDVIAVLALLAAAFSIVWQVVRARWEKPVVVVTGRVNRHWNRKHREQVLLTITITNVGEKPVTLMAAGWELTDHKKGDPGVTGFSNWSMKDRSEFPRRLEPHDFIEVPSKHDFVPMVAGRTMRPHVEVVRRPTWREVRRGIGAVRQISGNEISAPEAPLEPQTPRKAKAKMVVRGVTQVGD